MDGSLPHRRRQPVGGGHQEPPGVQLDAQRQVTERLAIQVHEGGGISHDLDQAAARLLDLGVPHVGAPVQVDELPQGGGATRMPPP